MPRTSRKHIRPDAPLGGLAEEYLEAMVACERNRACDCVMEAVERGESIKQIDLHVFQPVQYEIGWLWQSGAISVGQEHYCTNATQLIMSMLYPRIFKGERGGRRLVAACVQGELHEMGLRMLSDFFEMEGWNTDYLGASTPGESIVQAVRDLRPELLAIGVTMHDRLHEAAELIRAIREIELPRRIPILVGGYTFLAVDTLWRKIGADGTAADAQQALALATEFVVDRDRGGGCE